MYLLIETNTLKKGKLDVPYHAIAVSNKINVLKELVAHADWNEAEQEDGMYVQDSVENTEYVEHFKTKMTTVYTIVSVEKI